MNQPEPFEIHVDESVLTDLRQRLENTRLIPDDFNQRNIHYGQETDFQNKLLNHWKQNYDWRKFEKRLNSFHHYKMKIQGLKLHFIHEKSKNPKAVPLILVHGWPGSVWEFNKVIELLMNPKDANQAFHVVVPSLPGYGWSEAAKEPGMNVERMGDLFNELMISLGYDKYVAQGGDWGALITKEMAYHHSKHCVALHQNMALPTRRSPLYLMKFLFDMSPIGKKFLPENDQDRLRRLLEYTKSGMSYLLIQASKPHTVGYGLCDSPSGLLAWISEKIALWTDSRNGILQVLSEDDIITNVMIYWVTNTITSSFRLYFETIPFGKQSPDFVSDTRVGIVSVPTGIALLPGEPLAAPISWIKTQFNVVHCTEFKRGGHFAAWEVPEDFVADVQKFVYNDPNFFENCCKLSENNSKSSNWMLPTGVMLVALAALAKSKL